MTIAICVGAAACNPPALRSDKPGATQIPRDCEELAEQAAEPEWRKGQNPKALLAETTVALITANDNIGATRECQKRQREGFAGSAE